MNYYARVTTTEGRTISPVGVWIGGYTPGVRFYEVKRGRVQLLAAAPGLRLVQFGETRSWRDENGLHKEKLPDIIEGMLPVGIERIEHLVSCGCGSPLKSFVAPNQWETVDA